MKTEDYPIIIMAIETLNGKVEIKYSAAVNTGIVSISIKDSTDSRIKTFPDLAHTSSGQIAFAASGLASGEYTCQLEYNGIPVDSKPFSI